MRGRFVEAVTGAVVGLAVALTGVCVTVAALRPAGFWSVWLPLSAVLYLSVPIVGAAVVRAAPGNATGWILGVSGIALPGACTAYLLALAEHRAGHPVGWAGWWDGWPWVFALGLTPTIGLLLFPDGRPASRRWRPVLWLAVAQALALLLGLLFGKGMLDYPDQANPAGLPGAWGRLGDGLVGTILFVSPLSTLGAWSLTRRPRTPALRLIIPAAWTISASWWSCIVITAVGGDKANILAMPIEMFGMQALAVTAWIAIRRYGLFDGRRVLSRALVYGLLTALVVAVYLVTAWLARTLVSGAAGPAAGAAAALVTAIPLRDVLQRTVNRLIHGYRDNPYAAVVELGRRLEVAAASEAVLPDVTRAVRRMLRLAYVGVRVGDRVVAQSGTPGRGMVEEFPLMFAGELIGKLVTETAEEPLTVAERRLLTGLLAQVAAAGHAVALTGDLHRSRERLVGASEEERRRIRRDLHDGLGPALAGVVLGLQRARRHVAVDAEAAAEQIDVLTDQTQAAVAEVRRLVYGLRPPALDELGLVDALAEQARRLGGIEVTGGVPELPAAVEVAAYRIAMEGMTNTVRHARARRTDVRLTVASGTLCVEIADDGVGLPDGYRAGIGITSMRERAAELGGTCTIGPRFPNGTLVRASLPVTP
jgi:two-component system NarL family sensor kinase